MSSADLSDILNCMGIFFSSFLKHDFLKHKRSIVSITGTVMRAIIIITAIIIVVLLGDDGIDIMLVVCWVLTLLESSVWMLSILKSVFQQNL